MTQEEKNLLLKDLLPRLQYGVKIQTWYGEIITSDLNTFSIGYDEIDIEQLAGMKPYLRPISSMTEEEFKGLKSATDLNYNQLELVFWPGGSATLEFYLEEVPQYCIINVFDWLNAHHFDYRGLITAGLALEAPKDMYK